MIEADSIEVNKKNTNAKIVTADNGNISVIVPHSNKTTEHHEVVNTSFVKFMPNLPMR